MKKQTLVITEKIKQEWVMDALNYLKIVLPSLSATACEALAENGLLKASVKPKGDFLLIPQMKLNEVFFLKSGFVKMYSIDPLTGDEHLIYIWEPGSIIAMCNLFVADMPEEAFYLKLITDAELLSINNATLEGILKLHPELQLLREKVMGDKIRRMLTHTGILTLTDKRRRYPEFYKFFKGLRNVLGNYDTCRFLDISETILLASKKGV